MSDLALARRLLDGDESAFDAFFADYFPRLYRFALTRLAGDHDLAEEVAQCALITAVEKLHTFRGEAAMFTWLCTLCRREIARALERAGRAPSVTLSEDRPEAQAVLGRLAAARDDPEAALGSRETARLVQVTLDHLPRRYADALEWKYIEGVPVDEVARRLDLGYKAAESLLTRARQAFRDGFSTLAGGWPAPRRRATATTPEGA